MNIEKRVSRIALLMVLVSAVPVCLAYQMLEVFSLLVFCVLVSWVLVDPRKQSISPPQVTTLAVCVSLAYCLYRWPFGGSPPIFALGDFFILTACCKCLQAKDTRDLGQLIVLSGLIMICGAILSGDLTYPVVLVVYVFLGVYGLTLFHLLREQRTLAFRRGVMRQPSIHQDVGLADLLVPVRKTSLFTFFAILGSSVIVFFFFPRSGGNVFAGLPGGGGPVVTGFSGSAQFGNIGVIQRDDEEVMRVRLTLGGDNIGRANYQPYFRGIAFDRYSGIDPEHPRGFAGWQSVFKSGTQFEKLRIGPVSRNLIKQYRPWNKEARIVQEYWIKPKFAKALFALYPATDITTSEAQEVIRWVSDHALTPYRSSDELVHYSVSMPMIRSEALRRAIAEERAAYRIPEPVAPPDIPVSDRVKRLADQLRRDTPDPKSAYDVAVAIRSYLTSGEFTYTLDNTGYDPRRDPIDSFLFERKKGHCEFFASAMTILCQLNGIPARLVHGFHGGDYNDVGEYYLVRSEHAHSWVEIYLPSRDWIVMDPTPGTSEAVRYAKTWLDEVRNYVDYLTFQWVNRFIAYDGRPIPQAVRQLREARNPSSQGLLARFWNRVTRLFDSRADFPWYHQVLFWIATALIALFVILAARLLWEAGVRLLRWYRRRTESAALAADPRTWFYHQVVQLLGRLGHRRSLADTPREFGEMLRREYPHWPALQPVIEAYYQIEFGDRDLSPTQVESVRAVLESLRRATTSASS